jgi:hypothetical protein
MNYPATNSGVSNGIQMSDVTSGGELNPSERPKVRRTKFPFVFDLNRAFDRPMKNLISVSLIFCLIPLGCGNRSKENKPWSAEKANDWYRGRHWIVGCNFIPSTAINQLEMWQKETFDPNTIDSELGYAEKIGFNSIRVFLHYLAWKQDPESFKGRMDHFLTIARKHGISTMCVLFDDCWNGDPKPGLQPAPRSGVHNSGWVQCPGQKQVTDRAAFAGYKKYVMDIVSSFKNDQRIIAWDLYNEPGNSGHGEKTLRLLKNVFQWAREIRPSQPLTAGVWNKSAGFSRLNAFQLANSDVISFHNYDDAIGLRIAVDSLRTYKKPLICTEYMRRPVSQFATHLPFLKKEKVGACNWGLVSGKTQTIYPWDSWTKPYDAEPKIWFHDIFRKDGSPFDEKEIRLIRSLCLPG